MHPKRVFLECAWKAEIERGKLELGLESWNLIIQVHSSFCRTSQLELQFSIGIVYTIGLSTKVVLVARWAWKAEIGRGNQELGVESWN